MYQRKMLPPSGFRAETPYSSETLIRLHNVTAHKMTAFRMIVMVSCLAYFSTLKMEAMCSFET
jgi:hypothetical protein